MIDPEASFRMTQIDYPLPPHCCPRLPLRKNAKSAMMSRSGGFSEFMHPIGLAYGIAGLKAGIRFSIFCAAKAYLIGGIIERRE